MKQGARKWLARFVIATGQGDLVGFLLLGKKNMIKTVHHHSRERAVWYCSWSKEIRLGNYWREKGLTRRDGYELARLLNAAFDEGKES